ncbi:hypothetical protein CRYUN_Cryun09bG0005000 [Craigia yunnanensis]
MAWPSLEFDTVNGHNEKDDKEGNHVGININSVSSKYLDPAPYFVNGPKDLALEGDKHMPWIDYDRVQKIVKVTICPLEEEKLTESLISKYIDLTPVVKETIFRYKDLYTETKGFKEIEVTGLGGFGAVYRGVLPGTASEVAVKG